MLPQGLLVKHERLKRKPHLKRKQKALSISMFFQSNTHNNNNIKSNVTSSIIIETQRAILKLTLHPPPPPSSTLHLKETEIYVNEWRMSSS